MIRFGKCGRYGLCLVGVNVQEGVLNWLLRWCCSCAPYVLDGRDPVAGGLLAASGCCWLSLNMVGSHWVPAARVVVGMEMGVMGCWCFDCEVVSHVH